MWDIFFEERFKKHLIWFWSIFAGTIALIILLFILLSSGALGEMPSFNDLENQKNQLATEIISDDNVVLGNFFNENRTAVNYNQISPNIINALVATEDVRFYNHSGIDVKGLGRVAIRTVLMGDKTAGGGSTITQQLAKLLFHNASENIWSRSLQKLKEWVIAIKLEHNYSKQEILAMYLNKAPFIYDAYGIKAASQTFWSKNCDSLKIEEAATIIGMLKNPSLFNPIKRPKITEERRNVVLLQMQKAGHISKAEFDSLKQIPLQPKFSRADHKEGPAAYLREYIRITMSQSKPKLENYPSYGYQAFKEDSLEWVTNPLYGWINKNFKVDGTPYNLYNEGLKIHTTINSQLQAYAERALTEHLKTDLQPKFFKEKRNQVRAPFSYKLTNDEYNSIIRRSIRSSERYRSMKRRGLSDDAITIQMNRAVPMKVFSWNGERDTILSPIDSIRYYKFFLRASFVSMNPRNGEIKAYVGGPNFKHFMYDMVSVGKRQVGSTIKPFVYTLAMQEGLTPCDLAPNVPQSFDIAVGPDSIVNWTPKNTSKGRESEMVSLKWGLANSNNNITAWIMKQYSPEAVKNMIVNMGIKSHIEPVPALCLGTPDVSLLEMVSAYCTYTNKGYYIDPIVVSKITDKSGNVISEFHGHGREAIDENTAYLMLQLLKGVVERGTAGRLRGKYELRNEIGGKTGTTQNNSDGWFIGVTPNLVSGVWVGGEDRAIHFDVLSLGQGANMALPIWANYMKEVYKKNSLNIKYEDTFDLPLNYNIDNACADDGKFVEGEEIEEIMPSTAEEVEFY